MRNSLFLVVVFLGACDEREAQACLSQGVEARGAWLAAMGRSMDRVTAEVQGCEAPADFWQVRPGETDRQAMDRMTAWSDRCQTGAVMDLLPLAGLGSEWYHADDLSDLLDVLEHSIRFGESRPELAAEVALAQIGRASL